MFPVRLLIKVNAIERIFAIISEECAYLEHEIWDCRSMKTGKDFVCKQFFSTHGHTWESLLKFRRLQSDEE